MTTTTTAAATLPSPSPARAHIRAGENASPSISRHGVPQSKHPKGRVLLALSHVVLCLSLQLLLGTALVVAAAADRRQRGPRQFDGGNDLVVTGGIDFTGCQTDPDTGFCCIEKEETVTSLQRDPILECTHKNVEKCHYTYVTQFAPAQEEICEENFEKLCQVTFKQQAFNETVKKCYKPLQKNCNGQGPEECRTVYESSCTTRYVEKQPGKFVGDTSCEKLPVEICGAGCVTEEGPEECHEKVIASLVDVPEEVCDLNPQRTCRFQTKLVPSLKPKHECTVIPQETCSLKFTSPEQIEKPLKTRWCQDPTPSAPGESYEESASIPPVITFPEEGGGSLPVPELPSYEPEAQPPPPPRVEPPPSLYNANEIRNGRAQTFSQSQGFALPQNGFVRVGNGQRQRNNFQRQARQFGQRQRQQVRPQQFRRFRGQQGR